MKWIHTWYVSISSRSLKHQRRIKNPIRSYRTDLSSSQISLPRLSHLSTLLPRLHAFFSPHLIDPSVAPHTAWLSFENVPLKYHYPIGLLHDLFSGNPPADTDDDEVGSEEDRGRPWKLLVSYSNFPEDMLMGLDAEGRVQRDCYVNAVKEVSFVSSYHQSLLLLFLVAREILSDGRRQSLTDILTGRCNTQWQRKRIHGSKQTRL